MEQAAINEIIRRAKAGETYQSIADDFGIANSVVHYYARHADALERQRRYVENHASLRPTAKRRCRLCGNEGHYAKTCKAKNEIDSRLGRNGSGVPGEP